MSSYTIKAGQNLIIKGTALDDDGSAVTLTSGYTFAAVVKRFKGTADASALVDIDSANDAARFATSTNTITCTVITSAESNGATPGRYYYDLWAVETSTGEEYKIDGGTVFIKDAAAVAKS